MISAEKLLETAKKVDPGLLTLVSGALNSSISQVSDPDSAQKDSLCFVSDEKQLKTALEKGASVLICLEKMKETAQKSISSETLFSTKSISPAMAAVLPLFDKKLSSFYEGVHPTAVVAPTAKLGANVSVGPNAVIEAHAEVGANTKIGAGAVIEAHSKVGTNCLIHSNAVVGTRCIVGNFCELHSHVVIGSDGFGFAPDREGKLHKVPQLGIVVLEDHVEMGGGCAIDRATLGETRIGEGTKFDNLCHVAHNCKIGKHNAFAGGFMVAGSTTIGSHCMTGGGVVISDHLNICDRVQIGGRAVVTKDITAPGVYAGYPLEPMKDAMRTIANSTHVSKMRKQLAEVRKHLGMKDGE